MAKDNVSSNEVGKNAPIFLVEGSPELVDIDPLFVRIVGSGKLKNYGGDAYWGSGESLGGSSGNPSPIPVPIPSPGEPPVDPWLDPDPGKADYVITVVGFPPDLSDIQIKSQEVDFSVTPPRINVTFRVRNSTGRQVVGLNALVPKQ
jgi:hypothetical protein